MYLMFVTILVGIQKDGNWIIGQATDCNFSGLTKPHHHYSVSSKSFLQVTLLGKKSNNCEKLQILMTVANQINL